MMIGAWACISIFPSSVRCGLNMASRSIMISITVAPAAFNSVSAGNVLFKMIRFAKTILSAGLSGLACSLLMLSATAATPAARPVDLPLCFEANEGQADGSAPFIARGHDFQFLISPAEARIVLRQTGASPAVVQMQFAGANPRHKSTATLNWRAKSITSAAATLPSGARVCPCLPGSASSSFIPVSVWFTTAIKNAWNMTSPLRRGQRRRTSPCILMVWSEFPLTHRASSF